MGDGLWAGRLVHDVVVLPNQLELLLEREVAAVEQRVSLHALLVALELIEAVVRRPTQMGLHDLADVHARRHAQRVQDDVHRNAVFQEGHVFLGHDLGDDALVPVAAGQLVALGDLALLGHVDPHQTVDTRGEIVTGVAGELLDVDHDALLAVRHLEGGIAHLASLLFEDGADELLLRRELRLALGSDLAHQEVSRRDLSPDAHDAVLVQVGEGLLGAVGDVSGDLLVAQLRWSGLRPHTPRCAPR